MSWIEEVKEKQRRKNQILFDKKSSLLQELIQELSKQPRRVVVLWAFSFVEESVQILLEKYPDDTRILECLEYAKLWSMGEVKMPEAKAKILACHSVAKEIDDEVDQALIHAIGQGCSTVHTAGHGIGYPIYELNALVKKYGINHCEEMVERRVQEYFDRLTYYHKEEPFMQRQWARFLERGCNE